MTVRDEDAPRVLIFADILGFEQMTREIRVRVEDYPEDEHGFTGSGTTELQGRFVRFSNVLDRHVFEESLSGGVQAMLFSSRAACRCAWALARARSTIWSTKRTRRAVNHAL